MCQALTKRQRKTLLRGIARTWSQATIKVVIFSRCCARLLVGYVEFARNIRLKWKGYFVACEQALCLGKKIARKGRFPARPKACSQARYFISREALVARQFWKVLSPATLPRPISIPLSSSVSSRLQPRRHRFIDAIFRKVEERQAQSMPGWKRN